MARSEIVNKSSQKDPPVYRSTAIVKFNDYGKTYSYKISDEMVEKLRDKTKVKLGVYVGQDHHKEFKIVDLVRIDEFTLSHLATKEIVSIEECELNTKVKVRVKCLDNEGFINNLVLGKIYDAIDSEGFYKIPISSIDSKLFGYCKYRFEVVQDDYPIEEFGIISLPKTGKAGQVLVRTADGGSEWQDNPIVVKVEDQIATCKNIKNILEVTNDLKSGAWTILLEDESFEDNFNDQIYDALIDAEVSCDYGYNSVSIPKERLSELFKDVVSNVVQKLERVGGLPKTNEVNLNQKEEINMTNRRVVNVQLLDNDAGLDVDYALVHQWEGVVTEDSNEITIQEIISTGEVAEMILHHNELRSEQVDLEILNRTGQTVNLRPIKLKNLTWIVK